MGERVFFWSLGKIRHIQSPTGKIIYFPFFLTLRDETVIIGNFFNFKGDDLKERRITNRIFVFFDNI
jgi:hypothetical protein